MQSILELQELIESGDTTGLANDPVASWSTLSFSIC
ncbi:class III lanthipeptide [Rhodococcus sp. NPDC056743]